LACESAVFRLILGLSGAYEKLASRAGYLSPSLAVREAMKLEAVSFLDFYIW
jgi:hypothetical protein